MALSTLVLCFDGTWNTMQSRTNVSSLYSAVGDVTNGCAHQKKFYDDGVGTHWGERLRGGAFGYGLDKNIRDGYAWLANAYQEDPQEIEELANQATLDLAGQGNADAQQVASEQERVEQSVSGTTGVDPPFVSGSPIFVFGFSRGAFTARSLAGLINLLGLPRIDPSLVDPTKHSLADHPRIQEAWAFYASRPTPEQRSSKNASDIATVAKFDASLAEFRVERSRYPIRIRFLGVWDTVGSLGIPRVFDQDWLWRASKKFEFHDTTLGRSVQFAYHALAIDEQRLPYKATLWTGKKPDTEDVEQRWFPGAHADVGGGYPDDLLPAPPLLWLAQKAALRGLEFVNDRQLPDADGRIESSTPLAPAIFSLDGNEYRSPVHDSYAEFMGGTYRIMRELPWMGGRVFRRMMVEADGIGQAVDGTAFQKWQVDPDYRPPNLAQAGREDVAFNAVHDEAEVVMVQVPLPAV